MDATNGTLAKSTLAERIAKRIARMVREGDFTAGDRLPTISDMSDNFDVGHPTLREALQKLETLGVIEIKHGSGVYVRSNGDLLLVANPLVGREVSKEALLDLLCARIPIEMKSAQLAARNASSSNLERLADLLHEGEENIGNDRALAEVNRKFHREIADASGNEMISQIMEVISNRFKYEQQRIIRIHGSSKKNHTEHRDILDAIRSGDESLAEQQMQTHLEEARSIIEEWDPERNPISEELGNV